MGVLRYLYDLDFDPTDATNPRGTYTPYDFLPAGKTGIPNMSLTRDWGRRESIVAIPGADGVLDAYGRVPGPMDRRDITFGFRVIVGPGGNLDAAYDLLAAQVAPGYPQRLVYQTDSGFQWFTIGRNPSIRHTLTAENKGLTAYADFAVTWRIRPYWTPRYSQTADVWGVNDGVWGTADGTWGGSFAIPITAVSINFTIDATGTAGYDLPTIPDTGPVITVDGPAGGTLGLTLINFSRTWRDTTGVDHATQLTIPYVDTNKEAVLDCARQRFTLDGQVFRPTKANYQKWYMLIEPGIVNQFQLIQLGSSTTLGGSLLIDWWKRRA